jgi:hypothetical protein
VPNASKKNNFFKSLLTNELRQKIFSPSFSGMFNNATHCIITIQQNNTHISRYYVRVYVAPGSIWIDKPFGRKGLGEILLLGIALGLLPCLNR